MHISICTQVIPQAKLPNHAGIPKSIVIATAIFVYANDANRGNFV
jgi:hypothetical protein